LQVLLFHCSKREQAAQLNIVKRSLKKKGEQACSLIVFSEFCNLQIIPFPAAVLSFWPKSARLAKCQNEKFIGVGSISYPFPIQQKVQIQIKTYSVCCVVRGIEQ